MTSRLLLSAIVALLLASCGSGGPTAPVVDGDGTATDPGGSWVLVDAQPPIDVPDDARVTLEVVADGDAWQVGGTAACNSYSGMVVTEDSMWRGEGYAATEMGCEEPLMSAERTYLDALQAVDTWSRASADELLLTGPEVELRFEALPPVPTTELTGTTWVLDGLVSGAGPAASVSSTAVGANEATLRLEPDGTMDATTGCRILYGSGPKPSNEIVLTTLGVGAESPNVTADGAPAVRSTTSRNACPKVSWLGRASGSPDRRRTRRAGSASHRRDRSPSQAGRSRSSEAPE